LKSTYFNKCTLKGLGKVGILDGALECSQEMEKEAYFRWVLSME
jgi:hypothetical protein